VHFLSRERRFLWSGKIRRALAGEERCADFEQPNITLHVRQVVLSARDQRCEQIRPQVRFVLRERIGDADGRAFSFGDERHRTHFEQTRRDERLLDVRRMAETLLANPVIEEFTVRLAEDAS
jgi:hypothetical protein